jgi:hypothetical protein
LLPLLHGTHNKTGNILAQEKKKKERNLRDQEDHGLKPAWANSSQDPVLKKNPSHKGLVE